MTKVNPFKKFEVKPFKATIKALDAEITLKNLSIGEYEELMNKAVKGYDDKGEPIMDEKAALDLNYYIASKALVEPQMTVEELKNLSKDAQEAISEIVELVLPKELEGN